MSTETDFGNSSVAIYTKFGISKKRNSTSANCNKFEVFDVAVTELIIDLWVKRAWKTLTTKSYYKFMHVIIKESMTHFLSY